MPRNENEIYQSHTTRRKIREKKSTHSSRDGTPGLASLGGGGGGAFVRKRESSMKSPVSSVNRGWLASASMSAESMSGRSIGSWS